MIVVVIANQKGGVAKTTTAVNLGEALAERKKNVLLVDLDPQANATLALGLILPDGEPGVYSFLMGHSPLREVVRQSPVSGLDFLPSAIDLAGADLDLMSVLARERKLDRALDQHASDYDFVLIDTPPSFGILLHNAMVAARYAIIPVQPHPFGMAGLSRLIDLIAAVRDAYPDRLREWYILPTIVAGRESVVAQALADLRAAFGQRVLRTEIRKNVRVTESSGEGKPIRLYAKSSPGAADYSALADELLSLVE